MSDNLEDIKKMMEEGRVKGKGSAKGETLDKQERKAKVAGSEYLQDELKEGGAKIDTTADAAVTEHTVVGGDTLSGIAQKYYGSQVNWKKIYEANKETIGDNPSLIRAGQVLRIPKLD